MRVIANVTTIKFALRVQYFNCVHYTDFKMKQNNDGFSSFERVCVTHTV